VIRTVPSILALSTLSVLAAACGAAPESGESTESSESAVTAPPPPTACPLARVVSSKIWVDGTLPDPEEGIYKGTPGHYETMYSCSVLTGPAPQAPPGGWGSRVSSCSPLQAVMPPTALSQCTPGYQYSYTDASGLAYGEAAFLCPAGMAAPANDMSASPPVAYYGGQAPADGCLGPVLDTGTWQYVIYEWGTVPDSAALRPIVFPPQPDGMNCGGSCGCL